MKTETTRRYVKDYSKKELIFGNLAIIIWISLGAFSCALFYPLAFVVFFAATAFLVFYELGKHGCVTCYYCKTCTIGMGKLPGLFFRRAGTANVNTRALNLFPFTYLLLSALPTLLTISSLFQKLAISKILLLVAILIFSLYTGIVRQQTIVKSNWKRDRKGI